LPLKNDGQKASGSLMNKYIDQPRLSIRLTNLPPAWAVAGVEVLASTESLTLLTANDIGVTAQVDVVMHFGEYSDTACSRYGYGRLGFWFFRFAGGDLLAVDAARRAAAAGSAFETALWSKHADGREECLYQSFGYLEPFAIKRCLARSLAKTSHFPRRVLTRYHRSGELAHVNVATSTPLSCKLASHTIEARNVLYKAWRKLTATEQWFVVVGEGKGLLPAVEQKWVLNPPHDRFWADPFPVEKDGRRWVLFEELLYETWRGHLAAIELFEDGRHGAAQIIMESENHLSYPFVFDWTGNLYMVPESSADGNVVLWKCDQFPDRWTAVATILSNIRAADTTILQHAGRWWLFAAVAEEGACIHDELCLYHANSPLGPWQAHVANPIKSDARSARPAGNIFAVDGILHRPAQDCGTEYGKAIVINRIDRLDTEGFSETAVARIDESNHQGCVRTHTLSRSNSLWAVDKLRLLPKSHIFSTQNAPGRV
jgi:hypothetical protein